MERHFGDRNFGLDVLRATAIVLVLLSHSRFILVTVIPETKYLQLGGFWGVELFFVLSGFLIGKIIIKEVIHENNFSLATFWKRRWYRTLPNYVLFLFLNIVFLLTVSYTAPPVWKYFLFMQNFAWEHPQFFPESWSLAVEEVFYFFFPLLVMLLLKLKFKPERAFLLSGLFILLLSTTLRFVHVHLANPNWNQGVRTIVVYRLDALMYGILLAFYLHRPQRLSKRKKYAACAAGVTLLLISAVLFFSANRDEDYVSRTVLFSLTSLGFALVVPVVKELQVPRQAFLASCWRRMALWSYSLYLSNLLVYNLMNAFWLDQARKTIPNLLLAVCIFLTASLVVSAVVYKYYELPIMELRDKPGGGYAKWWRLKRA